MKDIKIFLQKEKKKKQQNDLEGYKDLSEDELIQYNRKHEIRKALKRLFIVIRKYFNFKNFTSV